MDDIRGQALAIAAERLKESAAQQNVYVSLSRAERMISPVLDAVRPMLVSHIAIERMRAAEEISEATPPPVLPLKPADEPTLRVERLERTLQRIERAAALHDLSDVRIGSLPQELRTIMAAYADCQMHLAKASQLLRQLADQRAAGSGHRATRKAAVWDIRPTSAAVRAKRKRAPARAAG